MTVTNTSKPWKPATHWHSQTHSHVEMNASLDRDNSTIERNLLGNGLITIYYVSQFHTVRRFDLWPTEYLSVVNYFQLLMSSGHATPIPLYLLWMFGFLKSIVFTKKSQFHKDFINDMPQPLCAAPCSCSAKLTNSPLIGPLLLPEGRKGECMIERISPSR